MCYKIIIVIKKNIIAFIKYWKAKNLKPKKSNKK